VSGDARHDFAIAGADQVRQLLVFVYRAIAILLSGQGNPVELEQV
jgi:hypothetical protein